MKRGEEGNMDMEIAKVDVAEVDKMADHLESFERKGEVFVHGERWSAISETPVRKDHAVVVTGIDGLTLRVRRANEDTQEQN